MVTGKLGRAWVGVWVDAHHGAWHGAWVGMWGGGGGDVDDVVGVVKWWVMLGGGIHVGLYHIGFLDIR